KSDGETFYTTVGAYDEENQLDIYTNFVTKLHYDSTQSELIIDYNSFFGINGPSGSGNEQYLGTRVGSITVEYHDNKIYFAGDNRYNDMNKGGIPCKNAFDSIKIDGNSEAFLAVI